MLKGTKHLRHSVDTRLPITYDILSKLIQAIPKVIVGHYNQNMLKSMMTLAYFCFLRIGEIAVKNEKEQFRVIQRDDVSFQEVEGCLVNMTISLKFFKHSNMQSKLLSIKMVKENFACPVYVLQQYLKLSKHNQGPLFKFA